MRPLSTIVTVGLLTLVSCGGGDTDVATDASVSDGATDTAPSASVDTTPDFDISDAEQSVVKIAAEGTFIDPDVGEQRNSAGVGSGVIISEDGLVVTNNHVVTGAALLRVTVPGVDGTVNAQVLGVSECSDLAVIQLEGNGYQALDYRTDDVTTGLDVYAAGYPASDAQTIDDVDYTLTRGIVSSVTADGATSWASVGSVIEHDARIRGGNSGGPLLDEAGRIVGINYAGIDATDQNYAIAIDDAVGVIDRLASGENVETIGINGQAVGDEVGVNGIWVASVESGSPADTAGIEPGDVITRLENLDMATDGTMTDYCDVIRTKGADATMRVEVFRFATEEVFDGQLNGTPLELTFSFAEEFADVVEAGAPDAGPATYESFVMVTDDTGSISVELPAEWNDIDGTPVVEFGPSIYASPNLDLLFDTFTTPGVVIEATRVDGPVDLVSVLMDYDYGAGCTFTGTEQYSDALYSGLIDTYVDCAGLGTSIFAVAVTNDSQSMIARILIQAVEPRDLDAADRIFATFVANP